MLGHQPVRGEGAALERWGRAQSTGWSRNEMVKDALESGCTIRHSSPELMMETESTEKASARRMRHETYSTKSLRYHVNTETS